MDGHEYMACTICDVVHEIHGIPEHGRLRCIRCKEILLRNPGPSIDAVLAASFSIAVLIMTALFGPFLNVKATGFTSEATLVETALAFSGGWNAPLAFAVMLMIVIVPIARAGALCYALLPLRLSGRLLPEAHHAFKLACDLRPWSMAEVFIIGVMVALVKIGGMATIGLGSGFWALVVVVVVVLIEGAMFDEKTLWRAIDQARTR